MPQGLCPHSSWRISERPEAGDAEEERDEEEVDGAAAVYQICYIPSGTIFLSDTNEFSLSLLGTSPNREFTYQFRNRTDLYAHCSGVKSHSPGSREEYAMSGYMSHGRPILIDGSLPRLFVEGGGGNWAVGGRE